MTSLSPQRSRRTQTHQINQGAMLNHPARETSQSPPLRERPRAIKGQSMPMLPSNAIFSVQQGSQQSSPTIPNNNGRRTPPLGQITRLLPTPPHPNPPNFDDRRMSPPPGLQQSLGQSNVGSQYPRPPVRVTGGSYPTKLHQLDEYQMTPELLADIERADQQYQSVQPNQPYPYGPDPRGDSPSSAKGPIRGPPDRTSPNNPDNGQQRGGWQNQPQQISRDSPKARDRPPAAANGPPFAQNQGQSHTPERRLSPVQHAPLVVPGEPHPSSYLAHFANREAAARRAPNNETRLNVSMASQTPPLQNIPTRTPDRSLPVQEEDEVTAKNNSGAWQVDDHPTEEEEFHSVSPTPSSDLNPQESNQRFDNAASHSTQTVHRDDDQASHTHENSHAQYVQRDKRDSNDEDGSYTPRSPTNGLPENDHGPYYSNQNMPGMNPALPAPRAKARNGSTDHVMLGLESAIQESSPTDAPQPPQPPQPTERASQYADQRQHNDNQHNGNNGNQYPNYPSREEYVYIHEQQERQQNPGSNGDGRYNHSQAYRDGFQSYGEDSTSAYIRSYLHSPRPDAPIPPTPHSQTAAPSPSPLLSGYGVSKDLPLYPPIPSYPSMRTAGSPYPFPYNHVRRNRQAPDPYLMHGLDHNSLTLTEQLARQYRIYAQNNQGNITDSTLSPSSTPFPNELFQQWANVHVKKKVAANPALDTASIRSSPSHQPISLDFPPAFQGARSKARGYQAKRRSYDRKPPPRVESTQPRETSPELSSSGEETSTAGEERPHSAPVERVTSTLHPLKTAVSVAGDNDDNGEWVDDDDADDFEDLIDLEHHPAFVRNISKRRRKWEVGWENLIQAFQALDRQTDATMVLLASPSHTTKLHALRSRSIRRQSQISNSMGMLQIRSGFSHVAAQRRAIRPDKSSLVDRLMVSSSSSGGDASDGSSGSVEENLRRALDAALGSLGAMGEVYEQREMRVLEELQRSREDRERVELLLRQVLGDRNPVKSQDQRAAA